MTTRRLKTESAAERVLNWLERHIERQDLGPGDSLPKEVEIAAATKTGRSSVREALTALKALGIIASRRKGGIRIVRHPILLGLRGYFAEHYDFRERYLDAREFRAAMEWGLGEIIFANISQMGRPTISSRLKPVNF